MSIANTENASYIPRHAGTLCPILAALDGARDAARAFQAWSDKPMSGAACVLCGALMGLIVRMVKNVLEQAVAMKNELDYTV